MDKILLKDIKLYGYHGVLEKEREIGQYFYIDIEIFLIWNRQVLLMIWEILWTIQ